MPNKWKPTTHVELDQLIEEKLGPVCRELVEEHGVIMVAICAIEHSRISSLLSCMEPVDAVKHLEAALEAYEKDRANKLVGSA